MTERWDTNPHSARVRLERIERLKFLIRRASLEGMLFGNRGGRVASNRRGTAVTQWERELRYLENRENNKHRKFLRVAS